MVCQISSQCHSWYTTLTEKSRMIIVSHKSRLHSLRLLMASNSVKYFRQPIGLFQNNVLGYQHDEKRL